MKASVAKLSLVLALTAALMSGCSSTDEQDAGFTDENGGASTSGVNDGSMSGSEFGGKNGSGGGNGFGDDGMGGGGSGGVDGNGKVIYFMYDSSQVMEEFVPVIASYARSLKNNPGQHLVVEGHADERGSREYNIALGEQRAKSVVRMLTMQGARDSQIEIVSYGEEKPAADGHDESAWQLNRRAVLNSEAR